MKRVSSGGVIYRIHNGSFDVALVLVKGKKTWCLPKGLINKDEDEPTAALREVREETGLNGDVLKKIGQVSYWFDLKDEAAKVNKTVHFYLIKFLNGNTEDHDDEVDEARWFPIDEAVRKLSFKSEKGIMEKAKNMIERRKLKRVSSAD